MSTLRLAFSAADPGLRRLGAAVRATASFLVVVIALLVVCGSTGIAWSLAIPGMLVAAVGSATIGMGLRERRRFVPLLLLAGSGSLGLVLGMLVLGDPLVSAAVFFGIAVTVIASTLLGTGGTIVALGGVAGFVAAAIVRPVWSDLPWTLGGVVIGAGLPVLMLTVLLRYRPRIHTRRMVGSLRTLVEQMPRAVAGGEQSARRHLDALEAAISVTRARIAADPDGWPDALRRGDGTALAELGARFELAVAAALAGKGTSDLDALVADPLLHAPERARTPARTSALDQPYAPPRLDWRRAARSLLSIATQLLTAVVLALAVAQVVDPRHWYWAVLAALVMVFGTTSAAASLSKGYRRVLGAIAGLAVGVAFSLLLGDNLILVALVAAVAMFAQHYAAELAYGVSVFALSVLVTVLFGLTTADSFATLPTHLLLTAAGAVIGTGVGFAVLPARIGETMRRHADDAMAEVLATLSGMAAGGRADEVTLAGRDALARFEVLRSEAKSSRRGWQLSRHERILAEQIGAGAIVARELRAAVHDYRARVIDRPGYSSAVADVAAKVAGIRADLTRGPSRSREESRPSAPTAPEHGLVRLELAIDGLADALRAG
ncbi:MAG: FUSC family protein [Pseudolysinimonas sp.]|uniref:FUSC family protein n=1 Tax=Pseudolysinimonas sp. TaxID=2680009 RepID=UPI003C78580A